MISKSKNLLKESLHQALEQCRQGTLKQFEGIDHTTFCTQPHPDFSPIGWHLGHIAYIEAYCLLEQCAGLPRIFPEYHQLFAANGLPKTQRVNLPSLDVIRHYLNTVRHQVFQYLEAAPLEKQERLWKFVLQHESQHSETIAIILQLHHLNTRSYKPIIKGQTTLNSSAVLSPSDLNSIKIPAGKFRMGSDAIEALDNEKPAHYSYLDTYYIDPYPVTCSQYREFMKAKGYQNPEWWSTEGWQWLQQNPVNQPLYWLDDPTLDHHPVCGVSWYEAEAYCNFIGKRLPTEAEWEKAASWNASAQTQQPYPWGDEEPNPKYCNCAHPIHSGFIHPQTSSVNAHPKGRSPYGLYDTLGNVWEWTGSWFDGYVGFQPYPYKNYSQAYFDGQHRILKGGSWATRPWALRCSFRNWYYPNVRQVLAGFRCASSS